MDIKFEPMTEEHSMEVMDIFNYYVENSFAAYLEQKLPYDFFERLLGMAGGYPSYAIKNIDGRVIGFCFLRPYHPVPVFRETAEISYFLDVNETGKGIGKEALALLEREGSKMGIKHILANISSRNKQSIGFHLKNGFAECGRFHNIGLKKGEYFDVVWMEKEIK